MEKVIFKVLDSFDISLIRRIKKLEVQNLGASAAINEWQIPVIIRYGRFVVAEDTSGDIIGVCEILRGWKDPASAFIHSFYIIKKYRHQGIGRKLLQFVIDMLKASAFNSVSLTVAPDNNAAARLYLNEGFEIKSILKNEYGPGIDRYLMEKML